MHDLRNAGRKTFFFTPLADCQMRGPEQQIKAFAVAGEKKARVPAEAKK
jgi:hypothetical protein